jgi:hypothetical protein
VLEYKEKIYFNYSAKYIKKSYNLIFIRIYLRRYKILLFPDSNIL